MSTNWLTNFFNLGAISTAGRLHLQPYTGEGAGPTSSMHQNTVGGAAAAGAPAAALGAMSLSGQQVPLGAAKVVK